MTAIETDSDLELFTLLSEDMPIPCSFEGCPHEATWYLLCPYDRSPEPLCEAHRKEVLSWPDSHLILFDTTCNHAPDVGTCLWERIKK